VIARIDLDTISQWVKTGSRVLDLGCGDGTLLANLALTKQVVGYGLEIGGDEINQCVAKGVNVIEHNLDTDGLQNFADDSFDIVIMTQAIQTLRYPDHILAEMLRIGRQCIVTFPNFGHWKARLQLLFRGRMPVSEQLPFEWYNTPNIHFCTFRDFEQLCHQRGFKIMRRQVVSDKPLDRLGAPLLPNFFGDTALYQLG
jgi:methionine biosynthesis protein MetW